MSRSKKIFAAFAFVFLLFLVFVVYDISTRTTFPGSAKKQDATPSKQESLSGDSLEADTIR
jgi:hypothetical protein